MINVPLVRLPIFYQGQLGVRGSDNSLGLRTTPQGNVYYVDSTHADASNDHDGTDPNHPKATLTSAIAAATANHGDVIVVGSNHAENLATGGAITVNKAGVHIVGYGAGEDRPTLTFTNAAGSVIVSSPNVTIENILFVCGADSILIMVDINADDVSLVDCELRENTAVAQQFLTAVDINGGGANAADRARIIGCRFISEAAGANQAIEIGAVEDGIELIGNFITGDYAVAGIHSGSILTNLLLANNNIRNVNAGDWAVELSAAATGMAIDNRFSSDALATCFDPGSLMCLGNLATDAIDQSGVPIPATAGGPLPAGSIDATVVADNTLDYATFAADAKFAELTVEKADGSVTTPTDALFTITGGPIMVVEFVGIVTVQVGAGASTCQIQALVTDPAGTVSLSTAVDLDGDATGTSYTFTAAAPGILTPTTAGALAAVPVARWLVPIGSIQAAFSASRAGNIKWYMVYKKLSPLSTVVAAA